MREIRTSGSTRGQWVAVHTVTHCPTLPANTKRRDCAAELSQSNWPPMNADERGFRTEPFE